MNARTKVRAAGFAVVVWLVGLACLLLLGLLVWALVVSAWLGPS